VAGHGEAGTFGDVALALFNSLVDELSNPAEEFGSCPLSPHPLARNRLLGDPNLTHHENAPPKWG